MTDKQVQNVDLHHHYHHRHHHHHHRHHRRMSKGLRILWSAIGALVVVALIFAGVAWHNISVTSNDMYSKSGADVKRNANQVLAQRKPVSILLLGTDTGALGRTDKGRTDTIMILTVNPKTKTTTIVSLPRDMKVNLPNYPQYSPSKINAAYTYGGVKESINTIQKKFNIPIDFYLLVNMNGLEKAINKVGGVNVTSPISFSFEGSTFQKGKTYHLNGQQALRFSRMRHEDPNGDYGRQQRQRLVIAALLKKSVSYKTVLNKSFLNSISNSSQTDLSLHDMLQLARHYRSARAHVVQDYADGDNDNEGGTSFQVVSHDETQRITNLLQNSLK
ncbi:LytR family transcriptional regulator [Limosilactobacillus frumenti DSM 13145]|uniref:LytR family transcriptional regulator n=1 Tax=Limosilactobacillus frumenti DSM 13145 TaxID=1423746 RepID=A0A0R1P3W6_9LACO|nr:LCP family protein [Limosilactobacillus frumenti]KRL27201.1 LytR family transcriptional regulator [Limosilactobacillus frumenti DSM 13145]